MNQLCQEAYNLGRDLGFLEMPYEQFRAKANLPEIRQKAERFRQDWPKQERWYKKGNLDQTTIDNYKLDAEHYEQRLLGDLIIEGATKQHKAFTIDWKWTAEDLVWNIQRILPELGIEFLSEGRKETPEGELITAQLKIRSNVVAAAANFDNPLQLVEFVNANLPDKYKEYRLVQYHNRGDYYGFMLIRRELVEKYQDNEFIPYFLQPLNSKREALFD